MSPTAARSAVTILPEKKKKGRRAVLLLLLLEREIEKENKRKRFEMRCESGSTTAPCDGWKAAVTGDYSTKMRGDEDDVVVGGGCGGRGGDVCGCGGWREMTREKEECCVDFEEYIRDEFRLVFCGQQQLIQMVEQLAKSREIPPQTTCGCETSKGHVHHMGVDDVKKETGFISTRSRASKHGLSIQPSDDDVDKEVDDALVNNEMDSDEENSDDHNIKGKCVAKDHMFSLDGLSVVKHAPVRPRKNCPKCPYVRPSRGAAVKRF